MLQRAASNAYSWWWASHVRTKQSKWLEHNLQDMEEKVKHMLEIIDEDGDSFAKRAEMYYKKRPELLSFVEEAYRGYRALAERYDHISRELQSANRTIATVYPEQAQFAMDDEGEDTSKTYCLNEGKKPMKDLPDVPKIGFLKRSSNKSFGKRGHVKRVASNVKSQLRSGLKKNEALAEIDKLQKGILVLQTEKEFVKSSYECGVAKYWDIEKEITEMQGNVSKLQDEFGIEMVIGDDEARTLMISAAIRSCQYSLDWLKARNEQSSEEANEEYQKINEAQEILKAFRNGSAKEDEEKEDLKWLNSRGKVKEDLGLDSLSSHNMTELVKGIDGLVKKVISLEMLVTSQTALVQRLRMETAQLQGRIAGKEKSNNNGINDSDNMMKEMEEELIRVKKLSKNVEEQKHDLHTQFVEASYNLDCLSEKLQTLRLVDGVQNVERNIKDVNTKNSEVEHAVDPTNISEDSIKDEEEDNDPGSPGASAKMNDDEGIEEDEEEEVEEEGKGSITDESNPDIKCDLEINSKICHEVGNVGGEKKLEDDQANWRKLMCQETQEREEILLEEYTTLLHDYREAKKKLAEVEKKKRDSLFESAMQIRDLRNANALKDEEIQALRGRLRIPKRNSDQSLNINSTDLKSALRSKSSPQGEQSLFDLLTVQNSSSRRTPTTMTDKFRTDIDLLMEETLEFWLRFSTSYHQILKFQTSIDDLKGEVFKVNKTTTRSNQQTLIKTEVRPLYKHLREIQTELTLWRENNILLRDELQTRSSALSSIEVEIGRVSSAKPGLDPETVVDEYQAGKFQGEVQNMKHENSKMEDELGESFGSVRRFQIEIERILKTMESDFGFQAVKNNNGKLQFQGTQRNSVPLRSFLFGVKSKRRPRKNSIFSACMNPAFQKQYSDLAYGLRT